MPPSPWKALHLLRISKIAPICQRTYARTAAKAPKTLDPPVAAPTVVPSIKLRDYQQECIQAILDHHEQGHRRLGVSLATGSGKTVIFTQLIKSVKPLRPDATQTLILVHRRELVEQAARQCFLTYPDKIIEIEMADKHSSGAADITVASIQSIISGDRIAKFDPTKFKLLLIDEAHHAVSTSYRQVLAHFGAMKEDADVNLVGVSATMSRADGIRLGQVMDHIVYHRDFVDMIEEGWLSKVMFTTVQTHVDLSQVKLAGGGDFAVGELSQMVNTDATNSVTVRSWIERAGTRKSTLVFCVDVAHVLAMTDMFRKHGYDAHYVTGDTQSKKRAKMLEDFKAGTFPVLVNCGVFTEGTDIPNIDCVLLARPTRSKGLLVQMIGRGMRLSEGKENCHVIDMVGSVTKGIITVPTLYGLDADVLVNHMTPEQMKETADKKRAEEEARALLKLSQIDISEPLQEYAAPTSVTFTDYDTIYDLIADTRTEHFIRQYSQNAWVCVGPSKFILQSPSNNFLRIEKKEDGNLQVTETKSLPEHISKKYAPFLRPTIILESAETLEQAVNGADTYANSKYPRNFILHRASWRMQSPPTSGQLRFIEKIRGEDAEELRSGLTKGQAADMITKLKFGASKNHKTLMVLKRKDEREKAAAEKLDNIQVGRVLKKQEKEKAAVMKLNSIPVGRIADVLNA